MELIGIVLQSQIKTFNEAISSCHFIAGKKIFTFKTKNIDQDFSLSLI